MKRAFRERAFLNHYTKFSREFSTKGFLIRAPLRNGMSTNICISRVILYMQASCMRARVHTYMYIHRYVNEETRARTSVRIYSQRPSSPRKSRCEIIMQKMRREDYDLICRAWKQFVSSEEGFLVNLRNYRLPRGCVCVVFSCEARMKWRKEKKKDTYVLTEMSICIPKMRRIHVFSCDQFKSKIAKINVFQIRPKILQIDNELFEMHHYRQNNLYFFIYWMKSF